MTKSIKRIVVIAGATASGKSALALSLAEKTGGVIINADSQQIYADLPILTARPTAEEESRVPHRLYGMLPAHETCSAGRWLTLARMEIDWTLAQGKCPIVVGGTGLYLKALLQGIAEIPAVPPEIRAQAVADYGTMGKEAFAARLKEADPEFFVRLKAHDRQRLIRAYEVWLATGKSLSWWQKQAAAPPYLEEQFEVFQVNIDREELYRRCDERFLKMIAQGAVEEVRRTGERENWGIGEKKASNSSIPNFPSSPILKIIGVSQILSYLQGGISLEEAISRAQQATRNYAKRQLTWFRHQLKGAQTLNSAEILKFH